MTTTWKHKVGKMFVVHSCHASSLIIPLGEDGTVVMELVMVLLNSDSGDESTMVKKRYTKENEVY